MARRSAIRAARQNIDVAVTIRKAWSAATLSRGGSAPNIPRPWAAAQITITTEVRTARLVPPGPKRTTAHTTSGSRKTRGMRWMVSSPGGEPRNAAGHDADERQREQHRLAAPARGTRRSTTRVRCARG